MRRWMSILLLSALIFTGCSYSGPSSERHEDDCNKLIHAVFKDDIATLQDMLDKGVDANVKCKTNGSTALWIAVRNGQFNIVKLLLENKADVNAKVSKDGKNYTPLSIAKETGRTHIVKILKEYGAE